VPSPLPGVSRVSSALSARPKQAVLHERCLTVHVAKVTCEHVFSHSHTLTLLSHRCWTASVPARGLEEFFPPGPAYDHAESGRAWTVHDLRNKSSVDLHKLW
jgi:hypothetical protein